MSPAKTMTLGLLGVPVAKHGMGMAGEGFVLAAARGNGVSPLRSCGKTRVISSMCGANGLLAGNGTTGRETRIGFRRFRDASGSN